MAWFWRQSGYSVFLLPVDCAESAKLLALGSDKMLVVTFGFNENLSAHVQAGEIPEAVSHFKNRFAKGRLAKLQWQGVLCSRQRFSKEQKKKVPTEIIVHDQNDFDKFLKSDFTTMTDIFREDCNRIRNMQELSDLLH